MAQDNRMHQNFGAPENTEIVGVRFRDTGKVYYFSPEGITAKEGEHVVVETARGLEFGEVMIGNKLVPTAELVPPLRPVLRIATKNDFERHEANVQLEKNAFDICLQKIHDHKLEMKLIDAEYTFDNNKLLFYFSAEGRVDFRELIKVFAEQFHIRIEMKQIGARQEAGRIGGIGACGRELCCASWISSFSSVTTGAARVQDLSLNPLKLAGQCSKLKCCLMYEYDLYMDARRSIPRIKEPLQAMDGEYFLVTTDILAKMRTFSSSKESMSNLVTIPVWRVKEILAANRNGEKVESIAGDSAPKKVEEPTYRTEEDSITRFDKSKKRKKRRQPKSQTRHDGEAEQNSEGAESQPAEQKTEGGTERKEHRHNNRNRRNHNRNRRQSGEGRAEHKSEKKTE